MAKAKALPSADAWPAEGLSIYAACKRVVPELWAALSTANHAARDIPAVMLVLGYDGTVQSSRTADEERRLAAREEALTALTTWVRCGVRSNEYELWACPDSRLAEPQQIPASAISHLEFNSEDGTASGKGLPRLYDVRVRRANASAIDLIRTGGPGRPTLMHLVEAEGRRRIEDGEVAVRQKGRWKFSEDLATWWGRERLRYGSPLPPPLTAKTIFNNKNLRELWNSKLGSVARP